MTISPYHIRNATETDAEGIAFVHVNSWKTSYAGIIDQDFLDNINYEKRLSSWQEIIQSKSTQELIVLLDGKIIGFVGFGFIRSKSRPEFFKDTETKVGEIYAIYLLEEHKRKSLGKALFNQCRLWFNLKELESFVVWALADNVHAKQFYEKEGGKSIGEMLITIGDRDYSEVCYLFKT
ncbi:GNAT family N-acetyltransferase [Kamptonema cortianum]|jgi:GNAT superfamily N-acetyltransferase|nr:GNAT family N-acetyltransferase [Geitlerinema splendidum]MDK3161276.1 GNAT family N-acetyltransferase [Kamptonema cortianum]